MAAARPDYRNWVPNGMLAVFWCSTAAAALLAAAASFLPTGMLRDAAAMLLAAASLILFFYAIRLTSMQRAFSYDGEQQLARKIVEMVASHVDLPDGGIGLDVGCGSGALTIACVKRNTQARMVGSDR